MKVNIKVNVEEIFGQLDRVQANQLPFAVSLGLNKLAEDVQAAIRRNMKEAFQLRRESWNMRSIKILKPDRATKTSWRVVITLDPRSDYFEKFEEGKFKFPISGRHFIWIPEEKTFKRKIIRQADPLRPKNLNLHRDSSGRIIGDQRTFMVNTMQGPMVMQRLKSHPGFTKGSIRRLNLKNFGNGARGQLQRLQRANEARTRVLYHLRESVKVKADLKFEASAVEVMRTKAVSRFRESMEKALASRR